MAEGTDPMIGLGVGAPALRAGVAEWIRDPVPEVVSRPTHRQFIAEHKLRISEETDRCSGLGEIGRTPRREGFVQLSPHGLTQGPGARALCRT